MIVYTHSGRSRVETHKHYCICHSSSNRFNHFLSRTVPAPPRSSRTSIEPSQERSLWHSRGPSGCTVPGYDNTRKWSCVCRAPHLHLSHPPTPQRTMSTPQFRNTWPNLLDIAVTLLPPSVYPFLVRTAHQRPLSSSYRKSL